MDLQEVSQQTMAPPFFSETFTNFMQQHHIEHITSSPLYPKSNGFIERQIKTFKTDLSTGHDSKLPIEDILLNIRIQPIGPNLPSPWEILHNCTEAHPGKPSTPVDMEAVRDYLITKKNLQKEYHDKTHNAKPLPELSQGQEVLFLSPADPNQYIEGTVLAKAPQPRSYLLESQGKPYHRTRQHICPLSNAVIPRPSEPEQQIKTISEPPASKHQNSTISGPPMSEEQKSTITRPPTPEHQNTSITRPSASPQYIPTISRPPTPKPIPAPCGKFLPRPPQLPTTTPTLADVMAHLNAINQPNINETTPEPEPAPADQLTESNLTSPVTFLTTDSEPEDSAETSTSSEDSQFTTSESSLASAASNRQLRPRYPISYNEKLLARLHGLPQIKTLNNLSIPLPSSNSNLEDTLEDEEDYEQVDNCVNRQ